MKTRTEQLDGSIARRLPVVALVVTLVAGMVQPALAGTQIDLVGPPGSGAFGTAVTVLPDGNIVVTDPYYDDGAVPDVGAVYLYDGATGAQISMLTGSTAGDRIGCSREPCTYHSVTVLSSGNYLVHSPYWDNTESKEGGKAVDAGAVTWGSGTAGVSGVVSAANSLVGSTPGDQVGYHPGGSQPTVTLLGNGHYLVRSHFWDNGPEVDAGAVTWGSGTSGVSGAVSAANSLVGSTAGDQVGWVMELSNGHYLVLSPRWSNGAATAAGAVTWGNGLTGVRGVISAANSLVGTHADDTVGYHFMSRVIALSNGNYVVPSSQWDNGTSSDVGAVTWCSGATGTSGPVSAANSLVGSSSSDLVGYEVEVLSNDNYVVLSPSWSNGPAAVAAGAVTWGSGTTGVSGEVSAANSLVGSSADDQIGWVSGYPGVLVLNNGNYLVVSPRWDNTASKEGATAANAGAVTWGNGATGTSGVVSAANSLVGSSTDDYVGYHYGQAVEILSNGNYVVQSPQWDNVSSKEAGTLVDAGAVTWGSGATGTSGPVSAANSLVGSTSYDYVGNVTELNNGHYVVLAPNWDNAASKEAGTIENAGAVTWANGLTGISGTISADNSLVGTTPSDQVGYYGVKPLSNGSYLVLSPLWNNGGATAAGAVTWGDGSSGAHGVVSAANSLVGSTTEDRIGCSDPYCNHGLYELSNGHYVVVSSWWHDGSGADVGAVTWGDGWVGVRGQVSAANSLVGGMAGDQLGYWGGMLLLTNGNYVVLSPYWDHGAAADAGAATWGTGTAGIAGPVSQANSLVGTAPGDQVGYAYPGSVALSDGNYVVVSRYWDGPSAPDAGAVTWGDGLTGISGAISAANSLVGAAYDQVGSKGVTVLSRGNYVVSSPAWAWSAGAATWGSEAAGVSGQVSAANSLVGSTAGDQVGTRVTALNNGHYVVGSEYWSNSGEAYAGAVTWGNGLVGTTGPVSAANSLVGSVMGDQVGYNGVTELSGGNYLAISPYWDNGAVVDAGAMTWGNGWSGVAGTIAADNSVRGTTENGGDAMVWTYDDVHQRLVVGRPADNVVSLFSDCVPLAGAAVSAPPVGFSGVPYDVSVTVTPPEATGPIAYTWTPQPDAGQGSTVATYSFATAGVYSVTVTAESCGGAVGGTATTVIIDEGAGALVEPGTGATLVYTDSQDNPTTVEALPGAVSEPAVLVLEPVGAVTPPPGLAFAHHALELTAYRDGRALPGLTFGVPLHITIEYSDADVAGLAEPSLGLLYATVGGWSADGVVIIGHDVVENRLEATAAHLTTFAAFASPLEHIYLPLVVRSH